MRIGTKCVHIYFVRDCTCVEFLAELGDELQFLLRKNFSGGIVRALSRIALARLASMDAIIPSVAPQQTVISLSGS
jgi:hypothetical protein